MIPAPVAAVCATFLDLVPPGLVTGLYLHGGTGFGEWIAGRSDVDFVATLARRPDDADMAALRAAHSEVRKRHPDLWFDGMHVLAEDLTRDPDLLPPVPTTLLGSFDAAGCPDAMVAWHELDWHGVAVAGPPLADVGIWTDRERLRAFTRENLDTYWRGWADRLAADPRLGAEEWACSWCVLGVARLHHLLVTGEMTTKSGAGRWGLGYYLAEHHRLLREASRIREGGPDEYPDEPGVRGRDTALFVADVVELVATAHEPQ